MSFGASEQYNRDIIERLSREKEELILRVEELSDEVGVLQYKLANDKGKHRAAAIIAETRWADLYESLRRGEASDGNHTHNELYKDRMLYHAFAVDAWIGVYDYDVVKSWKHSDGELCFGGGWFIVVAQLPTGQVSNHYRAEHWDLFDCPEVELPPEYDGHTPEVAAQRLLDELEGRW